MLFVFKNVFFFFKNPIETLGKNNEFLFQSLYRISKSDINTGVVSNLYIMLRTVVEGGWSSNYNKLQDNSCFSIFRGDKAER